MQFHTLEGIFGSSGGRSVILGFAPAKDLYRISFADVLNEDTGIGYQRRFNKKHSLDFRKYIQKDKGTTIPLTFNLRQSQDQSWDLKEFKNNRVLLKIKNTSKKYLSQVDCQHRLGHMSDLEVDLPFMIFIGLSLKEEMEVFNTINSKAKGLNTSLLDFHRTKLEEDLLVNNPELFIATELNNSIDSPWYKQLDLGGNKTTGMKRRASFRAMQKSIKKYLQNIVAPNIPPDTHLQFIKEFWKAIHFHLNHEWENPRKHIINKGIGVYALMEVASDLFNEASFEHVEPDQNFLSGKLSDFIHEIDWSNTGPFRGLGGQGGVKEALHIIRKSRRRALEVSTT